VQPKPAIIPRKAPPEEFVRKGSSPQWLCYVTECLQCGRFFRLKWPSGVEKFEETDVVHVECPSCLFEFAKTGDKRFFGNGSGRPGDTSGRGQGLSTGTFPFAGHKRTLRDTLAF
jgi:hypothetical protein